MAVIADSGRYVGVGFLGLILLALIVVAVHNAREEEFKRKTKGKDESEKAEYIEELKAAAAARWAIFNKLWGICGICFGIVFLIALTTGPSHPVRGGQAWQFPFQAGLILFSSLGIGAYQVWQARVSRRGPLIIQVLIWGLLIAATLGNLFRRMGLVE